MYSAGTDFTERKRKTYYTNNLSALSLVIIIVSIYSLDKKYHFIYLKTIENEMILCPAKFFNEKMREQLVKIRKERKKHVSHFSTFSNDDKANLFCRYENTQPKHQYFCQQKSSIIVNPLIAKPHKMVKHTQTVRREFADELFECA